MELFQIGALPTAVERQGHEDDVDDSAGLLHLLLLLGPQRDAQRLRLRRQPPGNLLSAPERLLAVVPVQRQPVHLRGKQ